MTQIMLTSSLYSAATLAAACASGTIPAPRSGERVLMVANNSLEPELAPATHEIAGFGAIAGVFDRVVDFNEFIHPYHPAEFAPRDDLHFWEAHARSHFDIGDEVELAVESIQVRPAQTVATIFAGAPITVYAEGLMSYGPTRDRLAHDIADRVDRVVYVDLLNGLEPQLLRELTVPYHGVDAAELRKVFAAMADHVDFDTQTLDGKPVVLGQYLSALRILSEAAERDLHSSLIRAGARAGGPEVCFKPHPGAPPAATEALIGDARAEGIDVRPIADANPLEVLLARATPACVVSTFSTGLITASRLFGVPVGRVGTAMLLETLKPYENSNRIPVTIIDHLVADVSDGRPPAVVNDDAFHAEHLQGLVDTVAYCMQPELLAMRRPQAEAFLAAQPDDVRRRYVKRRRLTALALPGATPVPLRNRALYRLGGKPIVAKMRRARRTLAGSSPGAAMSLLRRQFGRGS